MYRWRQTPDVNKFTYYFRVGTEVLIAWLVIYELVRLVITLQRRIFENKLCNRE